MKVVSGFFYGIVMAGVYSIVSMLMAPGADPEIGLLFFGIIFVLGFIVGLIDYDKKQQKKKEEEKKKQEQEQTQELMRQYLEKKLREEAENNANNQ